MTEPIRAVLTAWLEKARLRGDQYLFPSRIGKSPNVSTRQYARIVHHWAVAAGLESTIYGTHSGNFDLQTNQELEGRTVTPWPFQAGDF